MRKLIDGVRKVLSTSSVDLASISTLESIVATAVPRLAVTSLCSKLTKPGRYLCYKDADFGFVIMVLVWGPGDKTPIHDHGTWGVEAVLRNSLKVTQYTTCEKNPQATSSMVIQTGDVMHNLPPTCDVHRVEHNSGDYAVSLHLYGSEMTGNRMFIPGEGFKVCQLQCRDLALPDDLNLIDSSLANLSVNF